MKASIAFHFRRWWIPVIHIVVIANSLIGAFLLRFDFAIDPADVVLLHLGLALVIPTKMTAFLLAKLNHGWWRLVGMPDLVRVFAANVLGSLAFVVLTYTIIGSSFPRSVFVIDFILCFLSTGGVRFAVRLYSEVVLGHLTTPSDTNLLVYGAGVAGMTLVKELRSNPSIGRVVGFIDDDPKKRRMELMGIPVLGNGRQAPKIISRLKRRGQEINQIVIAMPSASGAQMREAIANARAADVKCRTIPSIAELLKGAVLSAQIRDLSVEDLLGREQVALDEKTIGRRVAGRVLLVTGAAGSIGSELCRQLARFHPAKLVALDQAESELFKIDLELRKTYPTLNLCPEIADIRDADSVRDVFQRHQIESVFHAAAYKHVPLMEAHVTEAVKNNIFGTWNVITAAYDYRTADFLMVSSDKAVNPANVMGATKRAAELLVSSMPVSETGTKFVSVRFGNVLGSNGSVVPLFKKQIADGGPVTVTHPDIRRYFMTIREAVQLILQASTMGRGSEIFVLEMGDPVRIVDLAKNMIRLSGLDPEKDIEIRFTGLRPGEKLFEELMKDTESFVPTYHKKILIFQSLRLNRNVVEDWLEKMQLLVEKRDDSALLAQLKELVPEYVPSRIPAQKERMDRLQIAASAQ